MKILSNGSFRNFDGFKEMDVKEVLTLVFDRTSISCTYDHRFLRNDNVWVEAQDMKLGEIYNSYILEKIVKENKYEKVYDAINVEKDKCFYAEGLIVHNCSLIYIDEFSFLSDWEEFSASVLPTISSGKTTKMIFSTTPKGLNHAYHYVEGARKGLNDFALVEVPWYKVPGRDEAWKQQTLSQLNNDLEKFEQEFCCSFIGSSSTLISGASLKLLIPENPLRVDPHLSLFEPPKGNNQYVITVDTSRGKGLDYSSVQVIDITSFPYKQVCSYRNNMISPTDFSEIIYQLHIQYNHASVLVELNDLGQQVADLLWEKEVDLIHTESKGRSGKQISFTAKSEKGIVTSRNTKAEGCAMLKLLIEQNQLIIKDKHTVDELNTFSKKNNSYEAEPGKHDDLVMCLVMFAWLCSKKYIDLLNDQSVMDAIRDQQEEDIYSGLLPVGIIAGVDEEEIVNF